MKKNIKSILALVLIIISASCSDNFLEDKKSYGQTDDTFYESEQQTTWYINNLYYDYFSAFKSPIQNVVGWYGSSNPYLTEELGGTQDFINPTKTLINDTDIPNYYGTKLENKINNNPYNRIRDCNAFLENIDTKGASQDEAFRNKCKGQVYYLRALQYFDLMRLYGGVPIVISTTNATSTDPSIQLPRATVTEVVNQIVADLDMAAELLPTNWGAADYGRFTKGAAMAQKSRVLLTYASPLFNKNWDTDNSRWQAALDAGLAAETQLTADGYGLYGTTAKDWENMFLVDNAFCKEAITVQLLSTGTTSVYMNNSWEGGIRPISQGGTGALEAPKEMIDLFPMADGSRPVPKVGSTGNYDPFIFFKGRDPRFYRTFAFSGAKWSYKENTSSVVWAYRWIDGSKTAKPAVYRDNNQESSPAFVKKMSNPAASNANKYIYSGTDIMEYRYAELLLNIAECYAALGNTANTITYLGKIRNRVGIPSANNYGIGTLADKYKAIEAVLYERRVELAYEGKRFWDIQRWMLYSDDALAGTVNNTCTKLGLTPINGTQRTGHYLEYKTEATATDPLATATTGISVDPDASNFTAQIAALETFYNNNFILTDLTTPMDNVNGTAVQIKWNSNYYIWGLHQAVLTQNTWLKQTIGWNNDSGVLGTFNYQN